MRWSDLWWLIPLMLPSALSTSQKDRVYEWTLRKICSLFHGGGSVLIDRDREDGVYWQCRKCKRIVR